MPLAVAGTDGSEGGGCILAWVLSVAQKGLQWQQSQVSQTHLANISCALSLGGRVTTTALKEFRVAGTHKQITSK